MTHELIMTSVSRGLRPETSGFCTIAKSADIPAELEAVLETPPRYRHLFPPESPEAPRNPVAWSHRIVRCGDALWHILARCGDAGIDFALHSNRLVHQLAFSQEECTREGPAEILSRKGVFLHSWVGPAVAFSRGRPLPTSAPPLFGPGSDSSDLMDTPLTGSLAIATDAFDTTTGPVQSDTVQSGAAQGRAFPPATGNGTSRCPLWEKCLGDAGWAGLLAETVYTSRSALLLFEPGMDLLPFFHEVLELLPPEDRWKATFTTFYAEPPLPPGLSGAAPLFAPAWRGIARPIWDDYRDGFTDDPLVIDMTGASGQAPDGLFAEFARGGSFLATPDTGIFPKDGVSGEDTVAHTEKTNGTGENDDGFFTLRDEFPSPPPPPILPYPPAPPPIPSNPEPPPTSSRADVANTLKPPVLPSSAPSSKTGDTLDTPENAVPKEAANAGTNVDSDGIPTNVPPVPTIIDTRTRSDSSADRFVAYLSTRPRYFFYTAYALALLLVLFLLGLLLDQQMKWGIAAAVHRNLFGPAQQEPDQVPSPSPRPAEKPMPEPEHKTEIGGSLADTNSPGNVGNSLPKPDSLNDEQTGPPSVPDEAERRRQRLESVLRRRTEQKPLVEEALRLWTPPREIPLPIPKDDTVQGTVDCPEPLTVEAFAPLKRVEHAIVLGLEPYAPATGIELRCRELNPTDREAVSENMPVDGLTDVPARWYIASYDRETEIEYPLCLLTLEKTGLVFQWLPDALTPQNLYDAGRIPFSMLTVAPRGTAGAETVDETPTDPAIPVEPVGQNVPVRISLFASRPLPPISIRRFLEEPEIETPTVFAMEPWNRIFEDTIPWDRLELRTRIEPEKIPGYAGYETVRTGSRQLAIDLNSDHLTDQSRLHAIATRLSLAVDEEGDLVLRSEHVRQMEDIETELANIAQTRKELDAEWNRIQESPLAPDQDPRQIRENRQRRVEIEAKQAELNSRERDLKKLREQLPKAYAEILALEDLRLFVSLHLHKNRPQKPEDGDAAAEDTTENPPPFLLMGARK